MCTLQRLSPHKYQGPFTYNIHIPTNCASIESTFSIRNRPGQFKYTGGNGVSYYLPGLTVWPAFQIFECRYREEYLPILGLFVWHIHARIRYSTYHLGVFESMIHREKPMDGMAVGVLVSNTANSANGPEPMVRAAHLGHRVVWHVGSRQWPR